MLIKKVTELTADAAPSSDDLIMTVNSPASSPANRKVTIANLFSNALAAPPAIGGSTPAAGTFTTINGTSIGATTVPTLRALIDEETEPVSDTLSANQCSGGLIDNIGMGAADVNYTLPAVAEGYNFIVLAGEPSGNYLRITAPLAGSMTVDGVHNMTYASLATPVKGNFMTVFTAKVAPGAVGILTGAALATGTTTDQIKTGAFTFYIAGVKYAKAAVDGTEPGTDVIPEDHYGVCALDIGVNGTLDAVVPDAQNNVGYDDLSSAVAAINAKAVEAEHVRIGYVTVMKDNGSFTFGTTGFDDANTTEAFTSTATYTAVYNWIVTTGAGTVTAG